MTDQPTPSPAAMVEVRDPCPHCGDHQLVPRVQMAEHLARLHPDQPTAARHTADTITDDELDRLYADRAALDRVRRLCDLTIRTSVRVAAVEQARDTLTAITPPKEN